jgi:hypothetical protein
LGTIFNNGSVTGIWMIVGVVVSTPVFFHTTAFSFYVKDVNLVA